ncbi:MAG TPA: L,D-transpeptidase [Longimicrobiales bacterium]|nr:L,D-transpeptidase [Longimicrobiales bacterium]
MPRALFPALAVLFTVGACAPVSTAFEHVRGVPSPERGNEAPAEVPPPINVPPGARGDLAAWKEGLSAEGRRILVSREIKQLWLMDGDSVVKTAPVAIGRDTIFRYGGRAYDFSTPTGKRTVLDKEERPLWIPPDWHYFEKAVEQELEPVHLSNGDRVVLSDSTAIEVRKGEVGRVNRFGSWWAFTPGSLIVFDGKIFIPPLNSPQRRIPKILGTHRLILGDGYLIHGTPEEDSIGQEASHGCIRMLNRDVAELYALVPKGTAVFVY